VGFEREKLLDDLKRKTRTIAESMEFSVLHVLKENDLKTANAIVEKFQYRERLQGCVIYDNEGKVFAVTKRFYDWINKEKPYLTEILETRQAAGRLEKFNQYYVYSYVLPVDDEDRLVGLVEVVYDTSYFLSRLTIIWQRISITLIILVFLIFTLSVFVNKQLFVMPIRRLADWFSDFQKGEIDWQNPIREKGDLGKLATEVEQVALSLRIARKTIAMEASDKLEKEDVWTESKLKNLVHAKLGEKALYVVSNREPYMHVKDNDSGVVKCIMPASGVVTAMNPILYACGGTWVAHGAGNADKNFVNSKNKLGVPPEDNRYILKRVWLTKQEEEGYYYGFSNEGLWPLCHNTHARPIFRESDWQIYKAVNRKFAESVIEELPAKNPFIFINDYHFTVLAKMIKDARPDAAIALFWHIPWPNPEAFSICPYRKAILEGMLGCDIIGFHVRNHCNNFLDTAGRLIESRIDMERFSVIREGRETFIRPFPISINKDFYKDSDEIKKQIGAIKDEFGLNGMIIGIGVERIDYTKGIVERILAIDRFFEKYPQYRKKVVFIQLAAPSRTHIKRYHDLISEIDELVEKKNWKYQEDTWKPILYLKKHFSPSEIKPYYAMADFCIVSSLHDGMNLVAKEYVASKNDLSGCLVLSQFTGVAREFTDAVLINPYYIEEFAQSIYLAVTMPEDEKRRRMRNMRNIITHNNVYAWAANIITELASVEKHGGGI